MQAVWTGRSERLAVSFLRAIGATVATATSAALAIATAVALPVATSSTLPVPTNVALSIATTIALLVAAPSIAEAQIAVVSHTPTLNAVAAGSTSVSVTFDRAVAQATINDNTFRV